MITVVLVFGYVLGILTPTFLSKVLSLGDLRRQFSASEPVPIRELMEHAVDTGMGRTTAEGRAARAARGRHANGAPK